MAAGVQMLSRYQPSVDINLFVHNGAETIATSIESVLNQTWPYRTLTVIDNASTDDTANIVRNYATAVPGIRLHQLRANAGSVVNCQHAFTFGDAEFVMPKTADDLIAPEFLERIMETLLRHPECAMCHTGALVFSGNGDITEPYPASHRLQAVGDDVRARARHVMARYTSAPSFWGVYRRSAVDRLARFAYRAGWDHVVLAELSLYGEIRHIGETLFWRRNGGKPVQCIARACTQAAQRDLPLDDNLAEIRWTTPLITTAYAHVEAFAVARVDSALRVRLMQDAIEIFRQRWLQLMKREAAVFNSMLTSRVTRALEAPGPASSWMLRQITEAVDAIDTIIPEAEVRSSLNQMAVSLGNQLKQRQRAPSFPVLGPPAD